MTKSKFLTAAAVALTAAVSFSTGASASTFAIDYHDAGVWNAYDADNEAYAMKFRSDLGKDGFWLVVTDGSNPKGDGTTNAILYGDLENNRITAYTYNGENNANSYEAGQYLGTYENVFSSGGTNPTRGYEQTMFSLDVSAINNALGPDFDGVELGPKAGIWFHQSAGSNFTYGEDGSITDYVFASQMWLDRGNDVTKEKRMINCTTDENIDRGAGEAPYLNSCGSTQIGGGGLVGSSSGGGSVPAPGGLAILLVGLAGLGRMRLRNKA